MLFALSRHNFANSSGKKCCSVAITIRVVLESRLDWVEVEAPEDVRHRLVFGFATLQLQIQNCRFRAVPVSAT